MFKLLPVILSLAKRGLAPLVLGLALSPMASAQENSPGGDSATIEDLPADIRLLIDISGSMKRNDPVNLRRPALELLVKLLPEDSKAGVWTFGKNINMLVPHRLVSDAWRENASAQIPKINSVGLYTNIGEALEKSAYDLDRPNDKFKTSVILLTDGLVDISKDPAANEKEWQRITDSILPSFQEAGYRIHTIALSDNADTELMSKLALATDGMVAVAGTADELMKIFLKVFDRAAPAEHLPLEENRFVVDSSIEEFTALIFRMPGSAPTVLRSPDKSQYSLAKEDRDVNWYRTDSYDLITVKRPIEGEWIVLADVAPDSRVTVVSDLNLLVKPLKSNLFVDENLPFSMLLREEGKTVTGGEFLGLLDISVEVVRREDGEIWSQSLSAGLPPGDGIFKSDLEMFNEEGHYDIRLVVDGKSFVREFKHSVAVRKAFGIKLDKDIANGLTEYTITVSAYDQNLNVDRTKVVARVKNPEGSSTIRPFTLTKQDSWQLVLHPDIEGVYKLNLRISAVDNQGDRYDELPDILTFSYPDSDNPFAAEPEAIVADIVAEPEPEPEPEPVSEDVAEPEPEPVSEAPEDSNWILYTGLGVGNIVIILLAFFAYRMIMGGKKGDSLSDLEKTMDDAIAELDEEDSAPVAEPAPAKAAEPAMEEVSMSAEPEAEPELSVATDDTLADDLMSGNLDLSQESVVDSELEGITLEVDDGDAATEEAPVEPEVEVEVEEEEDDDVGAFSLDDFAPENFDEDEDDK